MLYLHAVYAKFDGRGHWSKFKEENKRSSTVGKGMVNRG